MEKRKDARFAPSVLLCALLVVVTLRACQAVDPNSDSPQFTNVINNVTVAISREAILQCSVDSLSTFKVAWLRVDTQTILTIATHVITKNHRIAVTHSEHKTWYLHIKDVRESDRGFYMCQINTDPMKSQVGYLDVVVPPDILDYPTSGDMVVREGSNVSLQCAAAGSPEPMIVWRREGGEPIPLGKGREVPSVDGGIFNISKVKRLHMGPYLCIASNGVPPSVSKRIMLRVHFPPMLSVQNQLVGAVEGDTIMLECHSEAYPKSINYWTREDGIISHGAKYEPSFIDNEYKVHMKLTIKSVSASDYGSYRCISKNSLGETDGVIRLYQIPTPTTQKTTSTTSTTTSTTTLAPIIRTTVNKNKDITIKQRGQQKDSDLASNEIFDPEATRERDLRLRSNPSDSSKEELSASDHEFTYKSSSSSSSSSAIIVLPKLIYTLLILLTNIIVLV